MRLDMKLLTFTFLESKWRDCVLHVVEGPAPDERLGVVSGHYGHEVGDVPVQHVVHLSDQLLLQRRELEEICLREFLLEITHFRHI